MLLIQILLILFFLFAIAKVVGRWQTKELTLGALVMWLLFWLCAGTVVLMPNLTSYFAKLVGIGRGADLVVYTSLAILFFVVFRLMVAVGRLRSDITRLTRQITLDTSNHDTTAQQHNSTATRQSF